MELACAFDEDMADDLIVFGNQSAFRLRIVVARTLQRTAGHMRAKLTSLIRSESYLKAGIIRKSIVPYKYDSIPDLDPSVPGGAFHIGYYREWDVKAGVHVASNQLPYDDFKLVPNRITARARLKSKDWPTPGYKIGPGEPVRLAPLMESASRPFVARIRNKKGIYYRKDGRLLRARGISIQYFAAFERISEQVMDSVRDFFYDRLKHEDTWVEFKGKMWRLQKRLERQGF